MPLFKNLYRLFKEKECLMAEINPLIVTKQGELKAIDAKMTFDNNALFATRRRGLQRAYTRGED